MPNPELRNIPHPAELLVDLTIYNICRDFPDSDSLLEVIVKNLKGPRGSLVLQSISSNYTDDPWRSTPRSLDLTSSELMGKVTSGIESYLDLPPEDKIMFKKAAKTSK